MLEIRAAYPRRPLRPQRELATPDVRKAVHLLLHHLAGLAARAREQLEVLEQRRADLAVAVALEHTARAGLGPLPALDLAREQVTRAARGLVLHEINAPQGARAASRATAPARRPACRPPRRTPSTRDPAPSTGTTRRWRRPRSRVRSRPARAAAAAGRPTCSGAPGRARARAPRTRPDGRACPSSRTRWAPAGAAGR